MHEFPPGPESDRLRMFMTRQMDRHRAEVMGRTPVFGLVRPVLEGALAASNGESVTLAYGDPQEPSGLFVQVHTFFPPGARAMTGLLWTRTLPGSWQMSTAAWRSTREWRIGRENPCGGLWPHCWLATSM